MNTLSIFTVVEHRIDYDSAPHFQEELLEAVGDGSGTLLVDFAAVEAISSVGLRALVVAEKKAKAANGTIAICCLGPIVREVFLISRFDLLFPLFDSVDEARSALGAV